MRLIVRPSNRPIPRSTPIRRTTRSKGGSGSAPSGKSLILTDSARDANYLETAVRRTGLLPAVVTLGDGTYDGNPKGYDAVILNNVSRARLSPGTQDALVRYVADGGALAMVGGDQSFGLGGYESSSIAKIMPVVMKPPEHRQRKRRSS